MSKFRTLLFSFVALGLAVHAQAALLWDESVNGDLPNLRFEDEVLPNLVLQEGVNEIRGSASWAGIFVQGQYQGESDADRTRLTLLPGLQIDVIDYVFGNISLLQLADPFSPGVRMRQGYALTKGQYSVADALFYKYWDFSDVPGDEVPAPAGSFSVLPVTEPGNNYLFGTWDGGAGLPTEWDYSWDYIATITVSRSNVASVPTPGVLGLFIMALVGVFYTNRRPVQ